MTKRIINEINTRIYEHKKQMGVLTHTFLYYFSYSNSSLDVRKNKRAKCHNQRHYHHLILLPLIKTQCYTYPYLLTQQVATHYAAKKMFLELNWIIWYDLPCNGFMIIILIVIRFSFYINFIPLLQNCFPNFFQYFQFSGSFDVCRNDFYHIWRCSYSSK